MKWTHPTLRQLNSRPRRAFTLVELAMVILLIGVMAALAVPRYASAVDRYRADAAARKIAADLRWAQSRAVATGSQRLVMFNTSTSSYTIPGETNPDRPTQAFSVTLSSGPQSTTLVSANFGGSPSATFNGYGICAAAGTVVVRYGSISRTVQLDVTTGAVSVR